MDLIPSDLEASIIKKISFQKFNFARGHMAPDFADRRCFEFYGNSNSAAIAKDWFFSLNITFGDFQEVAFYLNCNIQCGAKHST